MTTWTADDIPGTQSPPGLGESPSPGPALAEVPPDDQRLVHHARTLSWERGTPFLTGRVANRKGRLVIVGYRVDPTVLAEARPIAAAGAEAKRALKEHLAREEAEQAARRRAEYLRQWSELSARHGWTQPPPEASPGGWHPTLVEDPDLKQYTREEWARLGFRASGPPSYLLVAPGNPRPLYWSGRVEPVGRDSELPPGQLWAFWRDQYTSDLLAATKALQALNKMLKFLPGCDEHSDPVYRLKDVVIERWLSPHLVSGRVSRQEVHEDWEDDSVVVRLLYEHHFRVEGHDVCFHSYLRPAKLDPTPGADLRRYGVRWRTDEIPVLRFGELLRVLRWAVRVVLPGATPAAAA